MKYLCLVYGDEKKLGAMSKSDADALTRDSLEYDEQLGSRGHLIVAEALAPTRLTQTVRVRDGKTIKIDGPFAETKEQLLGFVLIEARDESEALNIAAGIPLAKLGTIEVRAINELQ
jgi:hypothetical protein